MEVNSLKNIPITNVIKTDSFYNYSFYKGPRSMIASHYNKRTINGEIVQLFLNASNDSLIIHNASLNKTKTVKIPIESKLPISLLYFHNYDSIFVFVDREFVIKIRDYGENIADFVLLDTTGIIINSYSLDSVPHIYKGQLEPMVFVRKNWVFNNMISGDCFYIPFGVYRPHINDKRLNELNIKTLCKYNLKGKNIEMLNVTLPVSDIGNHYSDYINASNFDFIMKDYRTVIYSYFYSSKIFSYDLLKNKSRVVYEDNDFLFNNIIGDTLSQFHYSHFDCPKYSKSTGYYLRRISVSKYANTEDFNLIQILDSNFNLIGYNIADSAHKNLFIDAEGYPSIAKKDGNFYNHIKFQHPINYQLNEFKTEFLKRKYKHNPEDISGLDFEQKTSTYLKEMNVGRDQIVVFINSDMICSSCIYKVMDLYHKQKNLKSSIDIHFLFFGSDLLLSNELINSYRIEAKDVYIDIDDLYLNYFNTVNMTEIPIVRIENMDKLVIDTYNFDNLIEKIHQLQ